MLTDRSRIAPAQSARGPSRRALCSSLAIATALLVGPGLAQAQSFQANSTTTFGSAAVTTGSGTTTITVSSPSAVIDWTPFDTAVSNGAPINFQPSGTTATFQSTGQFAVLNRILPTDASRPVTFSGTVISQLQGTTTSPGGTVFFYSPGGILVGSSAVFNVGNLGLTSLAPVVDAAGNWYNGNQVQFQQGSSASFVNVQPGAQITASQQGSYIAAFAPRIVQDGTINVNGTAALVAGEAGTITFSPNGLFDIQVTVGTDAGGFFGIQHRGITTGPASTGPADLHRIYMVQIPKNQLINLLIERGSRVGFDVAGAADVVGNAIVLSSGYNVTGGAINSAPANAQLSDLAINDGNTNLTGGIDFTSSTIAKSTRIASVQSFTRTNFASNLSVIGGQADLSAAGLGGVGGNLTISGSAVISSVRTAPLPSSTTDSDYAFVTVVSGGATIQIGGNLTLDASASFDNNADGKVTGGTAQVTVGQGSSLSVGGTAIVRALGLTGGLTTPVAAMGGQALVTADGGTISVGGVTRIRADGGSGLGANATAGTSSLGILNGGSFTTNQLNVAANGDGRGLNNTPTAAPGTSAGGLATISVQGSGSILNVIAGNSIGNGNIGELDLLSAQGVAGSSNALGGRGGTALGGTATFSVLSGGVANLPINPGTAVGVRMFARATGGGTTAAGGTGGDATGGIVSLNINGGTVNAGNNILPSSFALAGSADPAAAGANGGNAFGGQRNVTIANGSLNGSFAGGGPGAQGGAGSLTGRGGNGTGGIANFTMDNSTITATTNAFGLSRVTAFAQNAGGAGAIGGNTSGGVVNVTIRNNSVITANPDTGGNGGIVSFGSLNQNLDTSAAGAISTGDATAGTVNVSITNSQIRADNFNLYSDAVSGGILTLSGAGANAQTGNATAGRATLNLDGATINARVASIEAVGVAGNGNDSGTVNGGTGTGGTPQVFARNSSSTITVSSQLVFDSSGTGGSVLAGAGSGGSGIGGSATLQAIAGGTLVVNGSTVLGAGANGGSAQGQGVGGNATAGFARVGGNGGSITFNGNLTATATSVGGNGRIGGNASGAAANAVPNIFIFANNGNLAVTGVTTIGADLRGGGGAFGGKGGDATGGFALVEAQSNLAGASSISLRDLIGSANAYGGVGGVGLSNGVGGAGGTAYAGNVQIFGDAGNGNLTVSAPAFLNALGFGGAGGQGGSGTAPGTGGVGGTGIGGATRFGTRTGIETGAINTGSASFAAVQALAHGAGGSGGAGGAGSVQGAGGAGGAAFNGAAAIVVRGSQVTLNQPVTLGADSTGGAGGAGSTTGAGGNATAGTDWMLANGGGVFVSVINRTLHPEQPGRLSAGNITGSATAFGGAGSTPGASLLGELPLRLEMTNSLATIGTLDLRDVASDATASITPSALVLVGSTASINNLSLITPGPLSVSLDGSTLNTATLTLSAGNFVLPTVAPALLGTINVTSGLNLTTRLDFLAYANFNVGFGGTIGVNGAFQTGDLAFAGPLDITAGGSITTGLIRASDVGLTAGAAIATGAITSNADIDLVAAGAVTTGQLTASDSASVSAGGALSVAGASAGLINPSTDPLAEYNIGLRSLVSVTAGDLSSRANIGLSSPGTIRVGNLSTGAIALALAGTGLTTGAITTAQNGRVYLANFSMEALGGQVTSAFNPAPILAAPLVAINGPIAINGAISTAVLQASTLQSLSITGATLARGAAFLSAGTTLSTGDVTVGDRVFFAAGGSINLGNVDAGITILTNGLRKIAIGSTSGTVTTGNLSAGFDLGIQAGGGISTGALRGRQILLLAGTNVSTAAVSAVANNQPVGQVYIGNYSMATQTSNVFQSFTGPTGAIPIFLTQPVRVGGGISFGGAVAAGSLYGAAAQGISLQAVTTPRATQTGSGGFIDLDSGGTVTVAGRLAAGSRIDIVSNDIDISQTGSIDALSITGEIQLASNNPNGAFIGDGLTTTNGYTLSNAEYGRLRGGHINVIADDGTLATDMTIGTLTINATQLYGADGLALFASGNRSTETPSGIVRVAGAVTGNGFGPNTELELLATTVEIEAEKGSIKLNAGASDTTQNTSASLGGLVVINADRIHVASDAILTKLRADPLYTGHIDELNAPAAVQRPDGVLNALGLDIMVGKTLYIQNTGSRVVPAGFFTTNDASDVFVSANPPTGGAEIVINGQFQTATGAATGKAAYDLVVASATPGEPQFVNFSSTSQLNGCVFLSGVCAFGQSDPVAALSSEITTVTSATLDESPIAPTADDSDEGDDGSSDKKDEDEKSDKGSSPIAPPAPLISTRALDGDVSVVEPVSGAGNPALFGSAVDETTVQGEKP
jgi:hypothetical protein